MENIQIINVENIAGELVEHIIIDRGNGEFTSMLKSTYDEQQAQAEQSTPSVSDEA